MTMAAGSQENGISLPSREELITALDFHHKRIVASLEELMMNRMDQLQTELVKAQRGMLQEMASKDRTVASRSSSYHSLSKVCPKLESQKKPRTSRAVDKAVMDNAMRGNTSGDENPALSPTESICSNQTDVSIEERHHFSVVPPPIPPAQDDQVARHTSRREHTPSSVSRPAATLMGLAQQRPHLHGTNTNDFIEDTEWAPQDHDLVAHPHSVLPTTGAALTSSGGICHAHGPLCDSSKDCSDSCDEGAIDVQCMRHLQLFWAFWGIVSYNESWKAQCYRSFTLLVAGCATAFQIMDLVQQPDSLFENIVAVSISITCVICLISLRRMDIFFGDRANILREHAQAHGFCVLWRRKGQQNILLTMVPCFCKAVAGIVQQCVWERMPSNYAALRLFVDVLAVGIYMGLVHCIRHVLVFLECMLDAYSTELFESNNWIHGVCYWNVVQAILHNASEQVDSCFLALQTSAALGFLCFAGRILYTIIFISDGTLTALFALPNLMVALHAFMLFMTAAHVTETCDRVTPVTNSVCIAPDNAMNLERQYLVNFISNSRSSFCIKGNRLSTALLLKYCYVLGAIVCGLVTTGLSLSRK